MGLQIPNYETNYGFQLENIYVKILQVNLTKTHCYFSLGYFKSKEDADSGAQHISIYNNSFDNPNVNMNSWEQVYNYIKTLPEFQNATDIL